MSRRFLNIVSAISLLLFLLSAANLLHALFVAATYRNNSVWHLWRIWLFSLFFLLLTTVLPMRWLWLYRRNRLGERKGLCLKCGYDLRASKDRCPECGTAIAADSAAGCEGKAI